MITLTPEIARKKYGEPNPTGKGYLVTIDLPYPMRVAWEKTTRIKKMQCHKDAAKAFLSVFNDLLEYYGYEQLVALGIDLYGGCFNYRKMRGGTKLSLHSWGVALDLHPDANLLKQTAETALFAKPEYRQMFNIFYKHGFESLGLESGYDFMHLNLSADPSKNKYKYVPDNKPITVIEEEVLSDSYYITQSRLNLRRGNTTHHKILRVIPKGERLEELVRCGDWSNVEYNGQQGWIANEYITKA